MGRCRDGCGRGPHRSATAGSSVTSTVGIVVITGGGNASRDRSLRLRGSWFLSVTSAHCVPKTPTPTPRRLPTSTGCAGPGRRRGSTILLLERSAPAPQVALPSATPPDSDRAGRDAGQNAEAGRPADSAACGADRNAPSVPCTQSAATSADERAIFPSTLCKAPPHELRLPEDGRPRPALARS
jgi:hypothetical protein